VRAVLDTGVFVSAIASRYGAAGVCGRIVMAAISGQYASVTCPALLRELEDVLRRPRFRRYLSAEDVSAYVALIGLVSSPQPDPPPAAGLTPDPKDDYLVALARSSGADYLVSGDPHLADLPTPRPPVLRPRAFLDLLEGQPEQTGTDSTAPEG
jgi:putative PIN family toxin of toxin-antitoxin system